MVRFGFDRYEVDFASIMHIQSFAKISVGYHYWANANSLSLNTKFVWILYTPTLRTVAFASACSVYKALLVKDIGWNRLKTIKTRYKVQEPTKSTKWIRYTRTYFCNAEGGMRSIILP